MASKDVVRRELMKLFLAYPQAHREEDELLLVLELWLESLDQVPDRILPRAMAAHRKASRFFPTVAEIVELANRIEQEEKREENFEQQRKALPQEPSEAAVARNLGWLKKIREKLAEGMRSPAQPQKKYREDDHEGIGG